MKLDPALDRRAASDASDVPYTEREFLILCLVAEGLSNPEVARRVHLSRQTVALHIAHMLRASGARSRAELVARAYCDGILSADVWPPTPPSHRMPVVQETRRELTRQAARSYWRLPATGLRLRLTHRPRDAAISNRFRHLAPCRCRQRKTSGTLPEDFLVMHATRLKT